MEKENDIDKNSASSFLEKVVNVHGVVEEIVLLDEGKDVKLNQDNKKMYTTLRKDFILNKQGLIPMLAL